jgi:hypothetical protein
MDPSGDIEGAAIALLVDSASLTDTHFCQLNTFFVVCGCCPPPSG